MLASMVNTERCANVKKRVYMNQVDEFQHSSAPLTGVVLSTIMSSIPYSRPLRPLKEGYVNDLTCDGGISPCAMMLGLLYIKRLSLSSPAYLTSVTPRELFLIAMVVASKYMNDEGELEALTNSDWAKVGSLTKTALDDLERMFLEAIDWRLYVSLEEYYTFVTSIEGQVALAEASRRGWFTYTDMTAIWDASDIQTLMMATSKQTAKVVGGGAAIYLVCVATLLTASHSTLTSVTPSPLTPTPLQPSNVTSSYHHLGLLTPDASSASESFQTIDAMLHIVEQRKPPDIFGEFIGGALSEDNCTTLKSCDKLTDTPTMNLHDYVPTGKSCDSVVMATSLETTYCTRCRMRIKNNGQYSYSDSRTGLTGFENKKSRNEESREDFTNNDYDSNEHSMMSSLLHHRGNTVSSPKVDSSSDLNFHLRGTFHWPPVNRTPVSNSEWNPVNYTITESVLLYTQSLLAY